ncbi:hypothetical protein DRO69_08825 [Candidatus Bathyarchaeota archaeon]|nr:MAG: hypothetical protein DRO69_08825 [Candidatus Bathyarchaeota archaeon]
MNRSKTLGILLILIGLLIVIHHIYITGRPLDLRDIANHEFIEAILFTAGITLLVASSFHKE